MAKGIPLEWIDPVLARRLKKLRNRPSPGQQCQAIRVALRFSAPFSRCPKHRRSDGPYCFKHADDVDRQIILAALLPDNWEEMQKQAIAALEVQRLLPTGREPSPSEVMKAVARLPKVKQAALAKAKEPERSDEEDPFTIDTSILDEWAIWEEDDDEATG